MFKPLDELYERADKLALAGKGRYDAINSVLGVDKRTPEIWAVEWQARISPEDWQDILVQHFATELERRAHARRVGDDRVGDDRDGMSPEEFEAEVQSLLVEATGAWDTIKYQDTDHVARALKELSRGWYAGGQADIAAGYRRVRIGEFKTEVHTELVKADAETPEALPAEQQAKFAALADDVWERGGIA